MLSQTTMTTAGVVLLTVVGIAYGGTFLKRVVTTRFPANELQVSFFRAGHAHAGVLVVLGLLVTLYVDLGRVAQPWATMSTGVLGSAILMPAGFFLSVLGRNPRRPNRLVVLLWLGVLSLVAGVAGAGIGLLTT
jgi:hypothetical protein